MDPIDPFKPIVGDDAGYVTPRLNQLPEDYGFSALTQHDDCPLTNAMWTKLIDFANRYYRHFEIVGRTYEDFQANLQLSYDIGADTLERQLRFMETISLSPFSEGPRRLHTTYKTPTRVDMTIQRTSTWMTNPQITAPLRTI